MISSLSSSTSAVSDYFSRVDTDGDSQITAAELKADFASHIDNTSTDDTESTEATQATPDFEQMVSDNDTDGDGTLSEIEYTTAMQAQGATPPPPPPPSGGASEDDDDDSDSTLTSTLSAIDTNGDGKISAAELAAAYEADNEDSASSDSSSSGTPPDFAGLVSSLDTDGDGALDGDELSTLITDSRRTEQQPPPPMGPPPEWNMGMETSAVSAIGEA